MPPWEGWRVSDMLGQTRCDVTDQSRFVEEDMAASESVITAASCPASLPGKLG